MSLRRAGGVVDHKRGLQRRVLRSEEVDPDGLSFEGSHIEAPQHVTRRFVQVREGRKSRQHRVAGIANLYLQLVEGSRGCCFSRRDLEPETQRNCVRGGGNRYLLEQRVCVRRAIAVEPRVERAGARRLAG